jgi:hypothetical protein
MADDFINDFQYISSKRKFITIVILTTFTFFGIICGAIGIYKFENYFHPYLFALLFGAIGFLLGIAIAKKLKPIYAVTEKLRSSYGRNLVTVGFTGIFLLLGHSLNLSLSTIEKCDNYPIIYKYYKKGRRHNLDQIVLFVKIEGRREKLRCDKNYFDEVKIGDKINVCKYSSLLGFDFFNLTDKKELIF